MLVVSSVWGGPVDDGTPATAEERLDLALETLRRIAAQWHPDRDPERVS